MMLVIVMVFFFFYLNLGNVFTAHEIFDWAENEKYRLRTCQELLSHYTGLTVDDFSTEYEMADRYLVYAFGEEIMREISPILLIPSMLAPLFLGVDFQKRTVNTAIYGGYTRLQIFVVKLLHYYIISIAVSLFGMISFVFYNFGIRGLQVLTIGYVLRCLLIQIYLMTSIFCVPTLIIYIFKNVLWGSFVNFLWMGFSFWLSLQYDPSTVVQSHSTLKQLLHPMYQALERNMLWAPELTLSASQWAMFILTPMVWIIGTTLLSYALFRRAELK